MRKRLTFALAIGCRLPSSRSRLPAPRSPVLTAPDGNTQDIDDHLQAEEARVRRRRRRSLSK